MPQTYGLARLFGGSGHLTAIDFNLERFNAAYIPESPDGGGTAAREVKPGSWRLGVCGAMNTYSSPCLFAQDMKSAPPVLIWSTLFVPQLPAPCMWTTSG